MIDEALREAEQKMAKAVEVAKDDFAAIRTGRAHPQMFAGILADYYGTPTPLQQLAGFQVPEPRTVLISPYDKGAMVAIEKAIRDSDLGLNPATVGELVRVPMPALTEERRRDLIKVVRHEAENARVAVRNIRRDANAHLKELLKQKKVSEDEERRAQDDVQKLTDRYIAEVDKLLHQKEADLMAV